MRAEMRGVGIPEKKSSLKCIEKGGRCSSALGWLFRIVGAKTNALLQNKRSRAANATQSRNALIPDFLQLPAEA